MLRFNFKVFNRGHCFIKVVNLLTPSWRGPPWMEPPFTPGARGVNGCKWGKFSNYRHHSCFERFQQHGKTHQIVCCLFKARLEGEKVTARFFKFDTWRSAGLFPLRRGFNAWEHSNLLLCHFFDRNHSKDRKRVENVFFWHLYGFTQEVWHQACFEGCWTHWKCGFGFKAWKPSVGLACGNSPSPWHVENIVGSTVNINN